MQPAHYGATPRTLLYNLQNSNSINWLTGLQNVNQWAEVVSQTYASSLPPAQVEGFKRYLLSKMKIPAKLIYKLLAKEMLSHEEKAAKIAAKTSRIQKMMTFPAWAEKVDSLAIRRIPSKHELQPLEEVNRRNDLWCWDEPKRELWFSRRAAYEQDWKTYADYSNLYEAFAQLIEEVKTAQNGISTAQIETELAFNRFAIALSWGKGVAAAKNALSSAKKKLAAENRHFDEAYAKLPNSYYAAHVALEKHKVAASAYTKAWNDGRALGIPNYPL